jgi:hypothetical protein
MNKLRTLSHAVSYHLLAFALIFWLFALPWAAYLSTVFVFMLFAVPGTACLVGVFAAVNEDTSQGVKMGLGVGFLLDVVILTTFALFTFQSAFAATLIIWGMNWITGELSDENLQKGIAALDEIKEKYR